MRNLVYSSSFANLKVLFFSFVALTFTTGILHAQSLGYEGPTGIFVTPLAATAASPANGAGHPVIAYHVLAGGPVIGTWNTVSITEGLPNALKLAIRARTMPQATHRTEPAMDRWLQHLPWKSQSCS